MTDDIDTLKLACAQFVRYQQELCDLLHEDTEGDSIALHTRIVYGIKAMKERLDPPPQAPIAQLTINQAGEIAGTLMYAPGLPPGDHDLYCQPEATAPYLRSVQPGEHS